MRQLRKAIRKLAAHIRWKQSLPRACRCHPCPVRAIVKHPMLPSVRTQRLKAAVFVSQGHGETHLALRDDVAM